MVKGHSSVALNEVLNVHSLLAIEVHLDTLLAAFAIYDSSVPKLSFCPGLVCFH